MNPSYTLLAQLPIIGSSVSDLTSYLSGMFKIGLGLAAVFAVLMIVWGGLEYIIAATPGGKGDGKEKITNALLGLLLALVSWLLLYTINPNLVTFNISSLTDLGFQRSQDVAVQQDLKNSTLNSLAAYKTSQESSAAGYAKLAQGNLAVEQGDQVTANELYAEGNTLLQQSWVQKSGEGDADLQGLVTRLEDLSISDYTLNYDKSKTAIIDVYEQAWQQLTNLNDPADASLMKQKESSALQILSQTLADEKLVRDQLTKADIIQKTTSAAGNALGVLGGVLTQGTVSSYLTTSRIQNTITSLQTSDAQAALNITDPDLKQKFNADSALRISSLQALIKK